MLIVWTDLSDSDNRVNNIWSLVEADRAPFHSSSHHHLLPDDQNQLQQWWNAFFFDIIKQRDHKYATPPPWKQFYVFLATAPTGVLTAGTAELSTKANLWERHIYGKTKALHHCGNYCTAFKDHPVVSKNISCNPWAVLLYMIFIAPS